MSNGERSAVSVTTDMMGTHGTHRDYESLIREAGEWGPWQWRMVAVMLVPAMTASAATLSWVFTARPGPPGCDGDHVIPDHGSLLGDLGAVCEGQWLASLLAPVFMLGMLLGAPLVGHISDTRGRRLGLLISLTIVTVSGGLQPLVPHSLAWATTWRLVTGLGTGGILVTTFVILIEWPTASTGTRSWRLVSALGLHLGWNLGQALLLVSASVFTDWRYLHWTAHSVGVLAIALLLTQPESARYPKTLAVNFSKLIKSCQVACCSQ